MKYQLITADGTPTGRVIEADQPPTLAANKGYWAEYTEPEPVTDTPSDWQHPDRPYRITVPVSKLFSSGTWIALWGYVQAMDIPSTLQDGNRVIYLSTIMPDHEAFIVSQGIEIEERP